MQLRSLPALVVLVAVVLGCDRIWEASPEPPAGAPNVVLITLDGLRADHLQTFGYSRATAPNIDWLASRGIAFSQIVPPSCSTKISLTSLLTSLDYRTHRVAQNAARLPESFETLGQRFAAAGWATAGFVGSPWLSASKHYDRGFQVYDDFREGEIRFVSADLVIGGALAFLRDREGESRPFFVYAHLKEPHPPWSSGSPWLEAPEPLTRFFDESCSYVPTDAELDAHDPATRRNLVAKYDGAITFADHWIGELLATLRQLDLLDDTIVAVSTDHGYELLDRYSGGHGNTPYEEVLRGFLVLFDGRGGLQAGERRAVQGRLFDVGPTLLALAGLPAPEDVDGVDLLSASSRLPEYAFSTCYAGQSVRSATHRLTRFDFAGFEARRKHHPAGVEEGSVLYDRRSDPGETRDVAGEQPRVRERMLQALDEYGSFRSEETLSPEAARDFDPKTRERLEALGYVE